MSKIPEPSNQNSKSAEILEKIILFFCWLTIQNTLICAQVSWIDDLIQIIWRKKIRSQVLGHRLFSTKIMSALHYLQYNSLVIDTETLCHTSIYKEEKFQFTILHTNTILQIVIFQTEASKGNIIWGWKEIPFQFILRRQIFSPSRKEEKSQKARTWNQYVIKHVYLFDKRDN